LLRIARDVGITLVFALGLLSFVLVVLAEEAQAQEYATWYALDGNPTASGEPMDSGRLALAHPYLPLGSEVLVTNPETGAEVPAVVNDVGPNADVTPALRDAVGMGDTGTLDITPL
jgi:rare lipoprotein A (peptidoglycan hydrolase)